VILTAVPYADDMNLGQAYNETFDLVGPDDWVALLDHDLFFTTPVWHRQLREAAAAEPEGCFTAITNRMANRWQVAPEAAGAVVRAANGSISRRGEDSVAHHRRVGTERLKTRTLLDVTETQGWGGVLMLISKRAWLDAGGFVDGLLCVDHVFHYALRAAGRKVWLIEGLYVFHWRGTSGGPRPPGPEIPRASDPRTGNGCPCRTIPHGDPKVRRRLP